MNIKPLCHCFCFIPMLNKELLSLEWVTDGPWFSSQCREVGTNRSSTMHARIPVVSTPEGSHMCGGWTKTVLPPCTCLPELACDVGDTSKLEFYKSSKLNSAIFIFRFISFRFIIGGFCSTFSSIFCLLPPWEKY